MPCLLQRGYEEKPWENFDIAKRNRGEKKNKPLSFTKQTLLKQKIVFTSSATSFMSNRKSLQVPSVNSMGEWFRTGDNIWHASYFVHSWVSLNPSQGIHRGIGATLFSCRYKFIWSESSCLLLSYTQHEKTKTNGVRMCVDHSTCFNTSLLREVHY